MKTAQDARAWVYESVIMSLRKRAATLKYGDLPSLDARPAQIKRAQKEMRRLADQLERRRAKLVMR